MRTKNVNTAEKRLIQIKNFSEIKTLRIKRKIIALKKTQIGKISKKFAIHQIESGQNLAQERDKTQIIPRKENNDMKRRKNMV